MRDIVKNVREGNLNLVNHAKITRYTNTVTILYVINVLGSNVIFV